MTRHGILPSLTNLLSMAMTDSHTAEDQLDKIEHYLRTHQLWQLNKPQPDALASTVPFALDTLSFEQWLQFLFLPKARAHVITHGHLPPGMRVGPMAHEVYQHQHNELVHQLMGLDNYNSWVTTNDQ
ncbi:YqcC family protein [Alteromonas lipotrueiana]|uniref:YqcC family protein n=1 Tax=Alteromonas lipotrueiana TaxID=2803815 RepID=UPI001C439764|nr:YqcC family protein [Alteromonas lipotrueiana]